MMLCRGQSPVPPEAARWEEFCERQDLMRKQADNTRLFWESCGRLVDTLRYLQRNRAGINWNFSYLLLFVEVLVTFCLFINTIISIQIL